MPYCTEADLIDRYGAPLLVDLTDRGETATGEIDSAVVAQAIAEADALIDGYLAVRYRLPLSVVPPQIAPLSRQIAIYRLHVFEANDKITEEHREALRQLQQIAAGAVRLEAEGVTPATTGGGGARMVDRARPMTADNLKGFI